MNNEQWLPVKNFEEYYEVSDKGNVRSLDREVNCSRGDKKRLWKGRQLKNLKSKNGYLQVSLCVNNIKYKKYVHRIVAETFMFDQIDETVNHKDGDKENNCLKNLEWVSYSYNNKHAFANKLKFPSPKKGYKNDYSTNCS